MKCPIGSTNAVHMLNKCAHEAYLLVVESISLNIGFFNRNNEDYIHISRCCRCLGCKTFLKTFVPVYFRNDNPIQFQIQFHPHTSLPLFLGITSKMVRLFQKGQFAKTKTKSTKSRIPLSHS